MAATIAPPVQVFGTNPMFTLLICAEYYRSEPRQLPIVLSINDYPVNVCFNKLVPLQGIPSSS